jgi:signal transduction histidine kinase
VTDDGEGFQLHRRDRLGMGIQNMRARAAKLNARLAIRTSPGKGTRLTLDLSQPS